MNTKKKNYLISIGFILPAFLVFSILLIYPIIHGFFFSFTNWDGISHDFKFVGLNNFAEIFSDQNALNALLRTLWFTFLIVIIQNGIALFLATVLDGNLKGRNFFKTVFFTPVILSPVVVGYLWSFIFDPQGGALTGIFSSIGLDNLASINWLGDDKFALYSVIAVLLWQYFGYSMVIYLSGLQSIPIEYYKASDIDGANSWQKFKHIKFPLVAPALTINMILSIIGALKLFDHIFVLTRGGPGRATETLSILIYRESFGISRMGYGAALSIILLIFIMCISMVQLKILQSRELEG